MADAFVAYGLLLGCTYTCKIFGSTVVYLTEGKLGRAEKYFTVLPTPFDFPALLLGPSKNQQRTIEDEISVDSPKKDLERAMKQAGYEPR